MAFNYSTFLSSISSSSSRAIAARFSWVHSYCAVLYSRSPSLYMEKERIYYFWFFWLKFYFAYIPFHKINMNNWFVIAKITKLLLFTQFMHGFETLSGKWLWFIYTHSTDTWIHYNCSNGVNYFATCIYNCRRSSGRYIMRVRQKRQKDVCVRARDRCGS